MPRTDSLSTRSTIWFSRVKPSPLITSLCLTGVEIAERIILNANLLGLSHD